jgi:hypothetical protein
MEKNLEHIQLIKDRLKTIQNFEKIMVSHAEENENIGRELVEIGIKKHKDLYYQNILGGYYVNENYFYYIELLGSKFIITRHIDLFERKTYLKPDELRVLKKSELHEISHIVIIGVCYLVDFHKMRLGL